MDNNIFTQHLANENLQCSIDHLISIKSEVVNSEKSFPLSFHQYFEMVFIENCIGRRFVGDHIEHFEGTELILIGNGLPHAFQYLKPLDPLQTASVTTIHFFRDFLGKDLIDGSNWGELGQLIVYAANGILFSEKKTLAKAKPFIQQMLDVNGLIRVSLFLQLLHLLLQTNFFKILSSPGINITEGFGDKIKINIILTYIFKNFRESVALEEIALKANMTPSTLYHFFRLRTGKTIIQFVKEVRVGYACKLLLMKRYDVTEVLYLCGFTNISDFNKQFKKIKDISADEFVKQYFKNSLPL